MKTRKTQRGFTLTEFTDLYGAKCSIQESSIATEGGAIWLGVDDPDPKILASKTPEGGTGWVPYPIPDDVLLTTRMHLNTEMAKKLVVLLNYFIEEGFLPSDIQ